MSTTTARAGQTAAHTFASLFAATASRSLGTTNCPTCGRFSRVISSGFDISGDDSGAAICAVHGRVTW